VLGAHFVHMSGHSHAKTIMATKTANDAKKGKIFSKYGRLITIAAKDGGDPTKNMKLKAAIEQAKQFNTPKENIERAIKKGTGELASESLEEVSYEGFGPGGIALIINGITDNSNRTLGEIKTTLNQNGGKMAGEGAVRWMFDRKGVITVALNGKTKEELELMAIELGAEDVSSRENMVDIYTKPEEFETVKKALEEKQIKIESSSIDMIAKEEVVLSEKEKEAAQRLFEALDENDAVNDIYSNIKN
jgi:YebC/PmpR family DNA-binding regulatory protein